MFKRLKTKLLINTFYHFQTNELFERTNQIVEIVLRFLFIENSNIEIIKILSTLQISLNNSSTFTTERSITEFMYEVKIRDVVFFFAIRFDQIVNDSKEMNIFKNTRIEFAKEAKKITFFVNVKIKVYYDFRRKSLLLNSKNETYIQLHHDYKLFDQISKKLKNQRCELFKIIRRVKRLAYKLQLSFR